MKPIKIAAASILLFVAVTAAFVFFDGTNVAAPVYTEPPGILETFLPPEAGAPTEETAVEESAVPTGVTQINMPPIYDLYWTLTVNPAEIKKGTLALVNDQYGFDPEDAKDLVSLSAEKTSSYLLTDKGGRLTAPVVENLNKMMDGFFAATGRRNVSILSSYRTIEKQTQILEGKAALSGIEEARKWVASPGYSEHHTGMSFDIAVVIDGIARTFKGNGDYGWFAEHCFEYGFIRRYPPEKVDITKISYEPWHFRYVGRPHAEIMSSLGLCLEEYIDFLRAYPFDGKHYIYELGGAVYELYYIEGCEIRLPKYKSSTFSGNNADGFIVTVEAANSAG